MNIAIGVKNFNISLIIREEILKISQKFKIPVNISIFKSGIELLMEKNKFDIIFIDTEINDINSIQISNCIRLTDDKKKLIFISDDDELIFHLLKYQPYRFIRKRYFKNELNEAIISIFKSLQDVNRSFICQNGKTKIPVNLNEIYFFEIFGHNIEVNTINTKLHITGTLNTLQNQLESFGFIRIHKSYLVNLKHIINFGSQKITMSNLAVLPVSKYKSTELKNKLKNYLIQNGALVYGK